MSNTNTLEKTDAQLKTDILSELKYDPSIKYTDIGVVVKNGTVTLNGSASSYGQKWDVVRATKRVGGVEAIADEIKIKFPSSLKVSDVDIAIGIIFGIVVWSSTPFAASWLIGTLIGVNILSDGVWMLTLPSGSSRPTLL